MLALVSFIIALTIIGNYLLVRDGGTDVTPVAAFFATLVNAALAWWIVSALGWNPLTAIYVLALIGSGIRMWYHAYTDGWLSTPVWYLLLSSVLTFVVYVNLWQHYA